MTKSEEKLIPNNTQACQIVTKHITKMVPNSVTNAVIKLVMNNYLISIVGPTGIGKTALSLKLASHFNTDIISADSRQFYKEIPIGTAAPNSEELASCTPSFHPPQIN